MTTPIVNEANRAGRASQTQVVHLLANYRTETGEISDSLLGPVDDATREKVKKSVAELVTPLVKADGGEVFLVALTSDDVHLHLAGTCAGCPGAAMTQKALINPVVASILPKATVKVTTGWRVPKGAEKIE